MNLVGYVKLYREQGFCAIPVPLGQKFPTIAWKEYQTRFPTKDELNGWWGHGEQTNVAIITGSISGNLCVIDFDEMAGLAHDLTDCYPYVATSIGVHVYTSIPGVQTTKFQYGDIKAEGGLVIAPPSLHPNGCHYQWVSEVGTVSLESLPEGVVPIKEKTTVADVTNGARNISLTSLAGAMRAKGASPSAILSALQVTNQEISEPLPEGELITISNSIGRYQPRDNCYHYVPDDFAKRDWV